MFVSSGHAQEPNPKPSNLFMRSIHLSIGGFGGLKRQFNHSFFPSYGFNVQLQILKVFAMQFDWNQAIENDSWDRDTDNGDGTSTQNDVIAYHKSASYMITVVLTPFATDKDFLPFFRAGISRNYYYGHNRWTIVSRNQEGEITDTSVWESLPQTEQTQFGIVASCGFRARTNFFLDFYGEAVYNYIGGNEYNGGFIYQAGMIFKIF